MAAYVHRYLIVLIFAAGPLAATDYHGVVRFGGVPVPGATVSASLGDRKLTAVTDAQGAYSFVDLSDEVWTVDVAMPGFAPIHAQVTVAPGAPASEWPLQMLPFADLLKEAAAPVAAAPVAAAAATPSGKAAASRAKSAGAATPQRSGGFQRADVNATSGASPGASPSSSAADAVPTNTGTPSNGSDTELTERASDGFLINGSTNNGAASAFSQNAAFGNNRTGVRSLYNGSLGLIFDNSAFDARSYSLTGQDTPRPAYQQTKGVFTLGGPLNIPHVLNNGPMFFVGYQWTRNRNDTTQSALVPTLAQRAGDLGDGLAIPSAQISPQAQALLSYYPLPNFTGSNIYNYQVPLVSDNHQDALQARLAKNIGAKLQLDGSFDMQRIATSSTNIFGFLDTGHTMGRGTGVNARYRVSPRLFLHSMFQYNYQAVRTTPYFTDRQNVSGEAGITGNDQNPANWGPPALIFANGIASLSDAIYSYNRNQTAWGTFDALWSHGRHNVTWGGDFRRQQFNYLAQQNPRGKFAFTGAATGSALGDFLTGTPDTSNIAFGNPDKYFRQNVMDAFVNDDWRVAPSLTINAGLRWEYGGPISELYGRLVNLQVAPGFTSATPVTGNSLVHSDKHAVEPRVGIAWRPFPASSLLVRAGYGVYYNTSVYQSIAAQMAQQVPFSHTVSVANTAANPLTLANGFVASATETAQTFAVDPDFRIGYSQNWQASVQRDLPGSLVATATYLGTKGTRGMQEFLPNTVPAGAVNPCTACPTGFVYLTSNGNSTREAGSMQLRRRLRSGFGASLQYTYSKSIDDSALGGRSNTNYVIAQNWLDLNAERGLSTFDQRHVLNLQMQYATGQGLRGGTLMSGWRGALFKEWTVITTVNAASGTPLTPIYLTAVTGTGITGPVRPNYNGGSALSLASYSAPLAGEWGNAGRDSITGPAQFTFNASLDRIFRLRDRLNLEMRFDATNILNHATWTTWNTTIGNPQFGEPAGANAMRSIQTTLRVRF